MIIGLDFDNTLICYDSVFSEIASEFGVVLPRDCPNPKRELQTQIRRRPNGEVTWTEIQAIAYGPKLMNAKAFPGLIDKLHQWKDAGHQLCIISHKTHYPTLGPLHDLRVEASDWITQNLHSLFDLSNEVFFESTQEEKLSRIASQVCDVFIDDLPEIISSNDFPRQCTGILFAPGKPEEGNSISTWDQMQLPDSPARVKGKIDSPQEKDFKELLPHSHKNSSFTRSMLSGGKNSQVQQLQFEGLSDLILKRYPNDNRLRLERETAFLTYSEQLPKAQIPRLLASDSDSNLCLMSKLEGEAFKPSDILEECFWIQSLEFIEVLQSQRDSAQAIQLHSATDSALSLQAHLGITTRRRNQTAAKTANSVNNVLSNWILKELESVFQEHARVLISNSNFKVTIKPSERIISPSDFGLHNAILQRNGQIAFFDFEYAGWDDPAKTWSDFFLQPRFPARKDLRKQALDKLSSCFSTDSKAALINRLPFVFASCSLNWIYIILNHRWSEVRSEKETESLKEELSNRANAAITAIREPEKFRESTL